MIITTILLRILMMNLKAIMEKITMEAMEAMEVMEVMEAMEAVVKLTQIMKKIVL